MADDAKRLYRLCVPIRPTLRTARRKGPSLARTLIEDYSHELGAYDKMLQAGTPDIPSGDSSSRKSSAAVNAPVSPCRSAIKFSSKLFSPDLPGKFQSSSARVSRTRPLPASREVPQFRCERCKYVTAACKDCTAKSKLLVPPRSGSVNRRQEASQLPLSNEALNSSSRVSIFQRVKANKRDLDCAAIVKNLDRLKVEEDLERFARTSSVDVRHNENSRFLCTTQKPSKPRDSIGPSVPKQFTTENACPNKTNILKPIRKAVFRKGPARIRSVDEFPIHHKASQGDKEVSLIHKQDATLLKGFQSPKDFSLSKAWRDSPADMSRRIELAKIAHEVYMDHKSKYPPILKNRRPKERFEIWSESSDEDLPKAVRFCQLEL